jgi:hypothetical protein
MIPQNILVTNAKDLLNHIIDNINKDNKVKKSMYKKYIDVFTKNIDIVLNEFNKTDCESVHFKLIDSKLYFNIGNNGVYEYYSTNLPVNAELIKQRGHPFLGLLIADLKSIIYKNGFKYIEDLLNRLLGGVGLGAKDRVPEAEREAFILSVGEKFAEQIDKLIITLSQHAKMADDVDGFVLAEWDDKRSLIDAKTLHMVCKNTDNFNEFFYKYIETTIVLMARSAFELEQIVDKIKYN